VADSSSGWQQVDVQEKHTSLELHWKTWQAPVLPAQPPVELQVFVQVTTDNEAGAFHWKLKAHCRSSEWSLWRVIFPQVQIPRLSEHSAALVPVASGQLRRDAWDVSITRRAVIRAAGGGACSF